MTALHRYAVAWAERQRASAQLIDATRRMVDSETKARAIVRDKGEQHLTLPSGSALSICLDGTGQLRIRRLS